jgi:hypothetical protein
MFIFDSRGQPAESLVFYHKIYCSNMSATQEVCGVILT